jgi:hypothetical protein
LNDQVKDRHGNTHDLLMMAFSSPVEISLECKITWLCLVPLLLLFAILNSRTAAKPTSRQGRTLPSP